MATKKEIRKQRFDKLRAAGFTSSEANKLKDRSDANIQAAISEKKKAAKNEQRREKYHTAREKGLSAKQAREARNFGKEKTERIKRVKNEIKDKDSFFDFIKRIGEPRKKPKELADYLTIPKATDVRDYEKWFLEPHNYVIEYRTDDGKVHTVTVTSLEPMTKQELADSLDRFFSERDSREENKYNKNRVITSSAQIVQYVYNPFANQGARKSMNEREKTKIRQRKERIKREYFN